MAVAQVLDVQSRLERPLTDDETAILPTLLDDAEALILERLPNILTDILTNAQLRKNLIRVEAYAVTRVIRNPDGLQQEAEGGYSYQQSLAVASGTLAIADSDWLLLGYRKGAYSVAPKVGDNYKPRWWNEPPWNFQYGDSDFDDDWSH